MTEKPAKPLSERIREVRDELIAEAKLARDENAPHDASMIALFSINFSFLAELAEEQAEIKAMFQARKDT